MGARTRGQATPHRGLPAGAAVVLGAGLALLLAAPAAAQQGGSDADAKRVNVRLMVHHMSQKPGGVDPAAADLHKRLKNEVRYESLRVIETQQLNLRMQESGGMELPTGKRINVRPMHLSDGGILIAVDIEGTIHTDVRVQDMRQVVIGADAYDGGKLVVTLEPDY